MTTKFEFNIPSYENRYVPTGLLRKRYLIAEWKHSCAMLHEPRLRDAIYVKHRAHIYAGIGTSKAGLPGHRWIGRCCVCATPFESVLEGGLDRPERIIGGDLPHPKWRGRHRCPTHVNPEKPTGDGFDAPALKVLQKERMPTGREAVWLWQAQGKQGHYHYFSPNKFDADWARSLVPNRRAELLAELF